MSRAVGSRNGLVGVCSSRIDEACCERKHNDDARASQARVGALLQVKALSQERCKDSKDFFSISRGVYTVAVGPNSDF